MTSSTPTTGTVADLVDHWSAQRHAGNYSPATVSAYLGAIGRILEAQNVPGTTLLDELDLPALLSAHEAAHPHLKASTLASVAAGLRAALSGYRARHKPALTEPFTVPNPEPDTEAGPLPAPEQAGATLFDGTLGHVPEFAERAGRSGLINPTTARLLADAVRRILTDAPEFAATPAADAEPDIIMKRFIERNPGLKNSTNASYGSRLMRGISAYCAYLADPNKLVLTPTPRRVAGRNSPRATEVPLPGGRCASFAAPADFTDAEAAATGALLRLYHPAMFTPASSLPLAANAWTLVFWPESAPDEPEAAHLTGPTFRRALADHIRARCPDLADHDDETAIDAWYATEVFVALAFDGHHHARDSGTLL